jgi:hypothetical protein
MPLCVLPILLPLPYNASLILLFSSAHPSFPTSDQVSQSNSDIPPENPATYCQTTQVPTPGVYYPLLCIRQILTRNTSNRICRKAANQTYANKIAQPLCEIMHGNPFSCFESTYSSTLFNGKSPDILIGKCVICSL